MNRRPEPGECWDMLPRYGAAGTEVGANADTHPWLAIGQLRVLQRNLFIGALITHADGRHSLKDAESVLKPARFDNHPPKADDRKQNFVDLQNLWTFGIPEFLTPSARATATTASVSSCRTMCSHDEFKAALRDRILEPAKKGTPSHVGRIVAVRARKDTLRNARGDTVTINTAIGEEYPWIFDTWLPAIVIATDDEKGKNSPGQPFWPFWTVMPMIHCPTFHDQYGPNDTRKGNPTVWATRGAPRKPYSVLTQLLMSVDYRPNANRVRSSGSSSKTSPVDIFGRRIDHGRRTQGRVRHHRTRRKNVLDAHRIGLGQSRRQHQRPDGRLARLGKAADPRRGAARARRPARRQRRCWRARRAAQQRSPAEPAVTSTRRSLCTQRRLRHLFSVFKTNATLRKPYPDASRGPNPSYGSAFALSQSMTTTTTTTPSSIPQSAEAERFLNAEEVSRELGIAKTSLYDRLAQGDLAHHRIGRLVRIRRHDLDAYIARTRVEARPPHRHARNPEA
jgi:excisionase family DNA binding protein